MEGDVAGEAVSDVMWRMELRNKEVMHDEREICRENPAKSVADLG
mgnify:CR=1 FL=1|tara:strand:- start:698 stop:832 length:135 start_codon:yes stop_codon:yes gene_type:complete